MHRLLAFVLLTGCGGATFVFSASVKGFVAKPDNCSIEVVSTYPERGVSELGTLEFYNGDEPKTLEAFKKAVRKQVCEVGGDAAIAIADDKNRYTKGTVLKYTDSGAPSTIVKPDKPDKPAPASQQTDTENPK
jgi:hypothetical protein